MKSTKGGNAIQRLRRGKAGLVVIDVQEKLMPAIDQNQLIIQNAARLIKGMQILGRPIFVTEQYRKGLGGTVLAIASALTGVTPWEKLVFSACGAAGFKNALKRAKVSDALLCGIETHVCVLQTGLDLLDEGFRVFVVADAVSSRTSENRYLALQRLHDAGAVAVSTEMVLFEML